MKLQYEYGELQPDGVTVNTAANAGNIAKQTISFSGQASPFVQTYRYDSLDRLKEAIEKVNGNQTWKQTFGYDRYGNRTSRYQIVGSSVLPINNITLPSVDQNKNRYNTGQGYSYDANGNIISDLDPSTGQGRTFVFNGDNKQTEVRDAYNNVVGVYSYDGNGNRVKKYVPSTGETTVFVYDGLGKLVAEYSTATPPANPTIHYTATDTLGSPRVITDRNGQVESRRDFMPFGEELYADGTYRTTAAKYSTTGFDAVRQRFTGYQRDEETSLDFAEARYYQNAHGRFTAVDPLLASGKSADPQTFNRYTYVLNNPLMFVDPTGLQAGRRVYVGVVNGRNHYTLRSKRPEGYREVRSETRVNADDGFTYRVNSRSMVAVGKWDRGVATPSQGIDTSVTPGEKSNGERLVDELGKRAPGAMNMIGVLASASIVGGASIGPVALATGGAVLASEVAAATLAAKMFVDDTAAGEAAIRGSTTLEPGPYAGESIEARGPGRDFTLEERQRINEIGRETGCHTCGTKVPGTQSGNFVPDHQRSSRLIVDGERQRLYPQCLSCSQRQGGQVRARLR